jgi:hypothetical protein
MDRVISSEIITARKKHRCDASEWWCNSGVNLEDCETEEQRQAVRDAEADKWLILPGQKYLKVTGIYDGDICTFRARPGMNKVCLELDIYDT